MRLTTKIILGIILSAFALSLLFIIGFSFTGRKEFKHIYKSNDIRIAQDNMTGIELKPYRVVVFDAIRTDAEKAYLYGFERDGCGLFLNPATTPEKENKLFIPEALHDFISTEIYNDTLFVGIKADELVKKYKQEDLYDYFFFTGINLHLYTSKVHVINKIDAVQTSIRNIETDSIQVNAWGDIHIDSCKAIVLDPVLEEKYKKLTVKNSCAKTINIDLDRVYDWNIENCEIGERNITGSKKHSIVQRRSESGKINWFPKNQDAELNINVQGDSTQIIIR